MSSHPPIVFLGAKRTPFGAFNGALADVNATELGVIASKAALSQAGVNAEDVDHVIFGNVMQTSADAIYLARHIGLKVGAPVATPAVTVNRLCGSGFESLVQGAHRLLLGESTMILAGGTENMSQAPHTLRGLRKGLKLGGAPMGDSLQEALFDTYVGAPMAITAENLAELYKISRDDADDYGFRSQTAWLTAHTEGRYAQEITPVVVKDRKGEITVTVDEHPQLSPLAPEKNRARFSREAMSKLPAIFKKDGTVTAANASQISDGGAGVVVASLAKAEALGVKPIAKIVSYHTSGIAPKDIFAAPIEGIKGALAKAKLSVNDIDLFEINEAFAAQVLCNIKALSVPESKLNICGGGVALGHPIGASGARVLTTLIHQLHRTGGKRGLAALCLGGGNAVAMVVETM